MGKVIVLGGLDVDHVVRVGRFPTPGESILGDTFDTYPGGKGLNQAIAASRLGADTTLVGCVGADAIGESLISVLAQERVDTSCIIRHAENATGATFVVVSAETGQNMIVGAPLANSALTAHVVKGIIASIPIDPFVHVHGVFLTQCETNIDGIVAGLEYGRTHGLMTILNAAPIPKEPPSEWISTLIDVLVVNELEASTLLSMEINGVPDALVAAELLLHLGPHHVIITLGSQGAVLRLPLTSAATTSHLHISPHPVIQVDSTGAGDVFCGALAAKLAEGEQLAHAVAWANAAGAISVTRRGAVPSIPTYEEIETLVRDAKA